MEKIGISPSILWGIYSEFILKWFITTRLTAETRGEYMISQTS